MKAMLWDVFEISINYYQGFIETFFIYKFLQLEAKRSSIIKLLVFSLIHGSIITVLNHYTIYEGFASALYFAALFGFALSVSKENLLKKIFASCVPILVVLVVTTVELNAFSSILGITVRQLISDRDIKRFICLLVIQLSIFILLIIALRSFKHAGDYRVSDWLPIITILSMSFVLASLLHVLSLSVNEDDRVYINLAYLVILILNFIMFYVIHSLFQKNKQINDMKLSALREQHMEQFVENANSQYESIRKIRHDIKDQLSTVYDLLSKGKTDEAMEFIADSNKVVDRIETFVQTNNVVANAIINSKLSVASTLGIKVSCITISDFDGINELDLCDLLGNTLENAITACKNMPPENNRFIYLEIGKENNIYSFLIKNSIPQSVIGNNPMLRTTKTDKNRHGFGVSIIKDIANKYKGRYDYYEQGNSFCCSVILRT